MLAVVPAAGRGSRLRPLTDDRPKCLVPVAGRPLVAHLLERLTDVGVDDVVVVTGYLADQVEEAVVGMAPRPAVAFVRNPDHASTNSIVSLGLTRHLWDGDVLVVDGDVVPSRRLLGRMVAAPETALAVDRTRPPSEIDMRVEMRGPNVVWLDHALPDDRTHGEFFGVSRWVGRKAHLLSDAIDDVVAGGGHWRWYEHAIRLVAADHPLAAVEADASEWAEVDAADDLPKAERFVSADRATTGPAIATAPCPETNHMEGSAHASDD